MSIKFTKSIIYGSVAVPIKKPESDHTHKWTVYVKGTNEEDISAYIKRVSFKLHESFSNPTRSTFLSFKIWLDVVDVDSFPFEITETGWGEFQLQIKIHFQDSNQKPVLLWHHLRLYPNGEDSNSVLKTTRPVVSEHYEEIVFDPPTTLMLDLLQKSNSNSPMSPPKDGNSDE